MLQPLVVAALYHREDVAGAKKRSPYFRADPRHEHIKNCTWGKRTESDTKSRTSADPVPEVSSAIAELGLVFKPEPPKGGAGSRKLEDPIEIEPADDDDGENNSDRVAADRPETSKFMATVAARYLLYSDDRRKNTALSIEGRSNGTFHSLCIPLHGFHPYYQRDRIYFGRVTVAELTNVFFVGFLSRINPAGGRLERTTKVDFKFSKRWIEVNDRALGALLLELASSKGSAWCFFYSDETPVDAGDGKVRFEIGDSAHFALIPESEIEANDRDLTD